MQFMVKFVHKISPSEKDVSGPVEIPNDAFKDKKSLGAALRKTHVKINYPGQSRILMSGESVRSFRQEGDDKIVVFPQGSSVWHAIVLTEA
jgi:hypothetical protein